MTRSLAQNKDLEWFDFPGYEDRFEITRCGIVRSKFRRVNSPVAGGSRRIGGKIRKHLMGTGYPDINTVINGKQKTLLIHRAIATLFVPNPEGKPCVNHIDGDKTNFDPENLEWCTHKENIRHAFRTGLNKYPKTGKGEDSPSAKLNDDAIRDIRKRLARGKSHASIADRYEVAPGTISFIAKGETWSHVK